MTHIEMSVEDATAAIHALSSHAFREDHVIVICPSLSEHRRILALAKQALTRGYVNRVTVDTTLRDLRVSIRFRKPPFPEFVRPMS